MKTTTILFAAIFTLQASVLFASNNNTVVPAAGKNAPVLISALAPVAPEEATFEEAALMPDFFALAPVAPAEATFEDSTMIPDYSALAPVAPEEADFDDAGLIPVPASLFPSVPSEAAFE